MLILPVLAYPVELAKVVIVMYNIYTAIVQGRDHEKNNDYFVAYFFWRITEQLRSQYNNLYTRLQYHCRWCRVSYLLHRIHGLSL